MNLSCCTIYDLISVKNTCFPVVYLIPVRFLKLRLFRTFAISNKISGPLRVRNNGRLLYSILIN